MTALLCLGPLGVYCYTDRVGILKSRVYRELSLAEPQQWT